MNIMFAGTFNNQGKQQSLPEKERDLNANQTNMIVDARTSCPNSALYGMLTTLK
jgi:hypothetical protein